tara:strand:- start:1672 stop:2238 length:567 start_codon:yes stop_codon:yes gene_type:complete
MSKNRYVFSTTLEGFINLGEPSGKYNNCCFKFTLPSDVMAEAEADREELLAWIETKVTGRVALNFPKWNEDGLVSYTFDGDTGRARPVFVDSNGDPLDLSVLKTVAKGTKVKIICQQVPYTKPAKGTTLKVLGVQVIELVAMNGASDSGTLSTEDVVEMFGTTEGFKASEPQVKQANTEPVAAGGYDF